MLVKGALDGFETSQILRQELIHLLENRLGAMFDIQALGEWMGMRHVEKRNTNWLSGVWVPLEKQSWRLQSIADLVICWNVHWHFYIIPWLWYCTDYSYLSSYPGYFREPHWFSMGLLEISRVTWQVWLLSTGRHGLPVICNLKINYRFACWWPEFSQDQWGSMKNDHQNFGFQAQKTLVRQATWLQIPVGLHTLRLKIKKREHFDGSGQDCSSSNASAKELLQSCTKPSIYIAETKIDIAFDVLSIGILNESLLSYLWQQKRNPLIRTHQCIIFTNQYL